MRAPAGFWSSQGIGVSLGLWLARDDAHVVRITDPLGRAMADTVSDGVALFTWQGSFNVQASTVEMLDDRGHVTMSRPYRRAS